MKTRDELIAADKSVEEICDEIGADSLQYLPTDAITDALGHSELDLCLGCVTGKYPYDIEGEERDRDVSRPDLGQPESTAD